MFLRQCEVVTDVDKLRVDLQKTFMKYKTIKDWAYIIHDKDDTRPHYHIYLHFDTSVDTKLIASWFDVPENLVGRVKGRKADVLSYLTHSNESQKNKYQYSTNEVVANFDFERVIEESKIIGDFKNYSYSQQLQFIQTLPVSEKTKAFNKLLTLWKIEVQSMLLDPSRNIKVVFITGGSGTGKTYYARKMLENMNLDYCISSSMNDPLQDYLGQKGLILDDLRDTSFEFEDLLKILDNNTKSSMRSRFQNKVFNGEVIVITSSVPLWKWYKYVSNSEQLYQLYRRISCYVVIDEEKIRIYDDGLDTIGRPTGECKVLENTLKKNVEKKNVDKFKFSKFFN